MPVEIEPVVKYKKIIDAIAKQLYVVWEGLSLSDNEDILSKIKNVKRIEVSDEQIFVEKEENERLEKGTLYVVVRFSSGPINFASSASPISLTCLGTENKVEPAQLLLSTFASWWTTKNLAQGLDGEIGDMMQVWNTPEVISNFVTFKTGFRNLFRTSGVIVIGPESVRVGTLDYIYDENLYDSSNGEEGYETINIMSFHDGFHSSLDTQPFGNTVGFAQSEVNFSTYTFSISTYLQDNHLCKAMLSIRGFRNRTKNTDEDSAIYNTDGSAKSSYFVFKPNNKIRIRLNFSNGFDNFVSANEATSFSGSTDDVLGNDFFEYFKVVDSQISQEIASIPTLTIAFSR